ncbi:hypothetical protein [Metabacillus niabensis]
MAINAVSTSFFLSVYNYYNETCWQGKETGTICGNIAIILYKTMVWL